MITSVFKKSTPLNLFLVVVLMLVFFLIFNYQDLSLINNSISIVVKVVTFLILLCSVLISSFIAKKNELTKDSSFTIFFYVLFLFFFHSVMGNFNLILSNFFILLALRRLISLQSLKATSEKIFDASLWIFAASLFQFWSIIFITLVYVAIILHVARDYRNWFLPFVALLAMGILATSFALLFNINIIKFFNENKVPYYSIDYFTNNYQNAAFSIYLTIALFFLVTMFLGLSNKLLKLSASYKQIILSFFFSIVIFVISPNKSSDLLIFSIAPLAIMATSHIEEKDTQWNKDIVLSVVILCSLFAFFSQL